MHIWHMYRQLALFNSETSVSIQKRHPYTGNLNSETSGDSKNAFLHCGDVSALVAHAGVSSVPHSQQQGAATHPRKHLARVPRLPAPLLQQVSP